MRPIRALALIVAGMYIGVVAAAAFLRRALPSRGDAESDEVALVAIYNGIQLKSRAQAFRGGSMLAWYGGIAVDLREATPAPEARLSLSSFFGGIAVRVPPGWRVESSMRAIAGGVEVKVPEPEDPAAPTLTLDGFALFGGIAVGARVADAAFTD
jgi:hypothetical protein